MVDISVPSLILFIVNIVVATGISGVLIDTVTGIGSSLDEHGDDTSTEIRAGTKVISGPQAGVYDDGSDNLLIYIKDTNLRTLPTANDGFNITVSGQYRTNVTVNVVDGTEWRPNNVIELTVTDIALSSGDYRMTIVVDGNEEVFKSRVP